MTMNTYVEAQKQLLRILAHHMIQIAERAHVLDKQKASDHILENAYRLWDRKAVFEWEIVQAENPLELKEDSNCFSGLSHTMQKPCLAAMHYCRQTAVNSNAANSGNSFTDIFTSDSFKERSTAGITGVLDNPIIGRCVFCNNALDADGLCRPCLLLDIDFPIDETLDALDNPPPCRMALETQNSAMNSSTPYSSNLWNRLDPPNFLGEDTDGMSTASSWLDLENPFTTYPNPTWLGDTSGASSLSMPWTESAPEPLTYGVSVFASPMDTFTSSSSKLKIGDGHYEERIDPKNGHLQDIPSSTPARCSECPVYREHSGLRSRVNTNNLRRKKKAMNYGMAREKAMIYRMACAPRVYPRGSEVRVSVR